MKRVIIIILLVIAIVLGYQIVVNGVENSDGEILISSYSQVEDASTDLSTDIAAYNTLNDTQYNAMLTSLSTSITNYKEAKEEYDTLIAELETMVDETAEDGEEVVYVSPITGYEIDFLWATIGNYAKAEGITMTMDVNRTSGTGADITGYDYYNLSFSVTGQYIDIASFLYAIEDDDRLNFEIRNFSMTSGAATFTVPNVPIDSETLAQSTSSDSSTTTTEDNITTDGSTEENSNTAVGNETVSSNSTNSTNTTNDTNSTNTSNTSNNVTNTTNSVNNTTN